MKNESFAEVVMPPKDEDIPYIRELMSYDAACPSSCLFDRSTEGFLIPANLPSPLHWSRQTEWPWILKNGDFRPNDFVLDVGGGWSVLRYAIAKRVKHVTSIDVDLDSVIKAKESAEELDRSYITNKIYHCCEDARKIPYYDGSFDKVVCVSVLEHMVDGFTVALDEMKRVLRPGGLLLITFDVTMGNHDVKDNFFVNMQIGSDVLNNLGITNLVNNIGTSALTGDNCRVFVTMVKWVKPLEKQ